MISLTLEAQAFVIPFIDHMETVGIIMRFSCDYVAAYRASIFIWINHVITFIIFNQSPKFLLPIVIEGTLQPDA